jgi:hypothetical protein
VATVALIAALVATHADALRRVHRSGNARDFATYYYAVQTALDGDDPYVRGNLGARARADGTRRAVHPFFYPPPALLGMVWVAPFSLKSAYIVWFWIQELALLGTLVVLRRWLGAPLLLLLGVTAALSPIPDSLAMGQVNLVVGLLALLGLWRGAGGWVGAAAMAKMAPALYLAGWGARGALRPVWAACGVAVALSLLALPVVDAETQWRFYTQVLPGFSSGDYNGLTVPITLPANHSIPDLYHQLWPGPDDHHLSERAALAGRITSLALLAGLAGVARRARGPTGMGAAFGAITVLMLITPVYTYEHHLALLLLPVVASGVALLRGVLRPAWWAPWGLALALASTPLGWLRAAKKAAPAAEWLIQESKFAALVLLLVVCVAAAWASSEAPSAAAAD